MVHREMLGVSWLVHTIPLQVSLVQVLVLPLSLVQARVLVP